MRKWADKLPVFRGELRDTARMPESYVWVISNCLSSRYPIKQANDAFGSPAAHGQYRA